jgi:phage protein D
VQIAYKITADGSNITDLVKDRLLDCNITDQAGVKSDRLTLTLDDRDQRLEIPETGAELQVWLGYVGETLVNMGKFTVDEVAVNGPAREMTIRATAADMTGDIKSPRERSWDNVSLGDVVRTIAGEHRLTASISAELAAVQLGHIDQTESDMQLLTRLCSDQSATCKLADGRLVVANRASGKSTSGGDLPVANIDASDCGDWSANITERGRYKTVIAQWHDLKTGKRNEERAGSGKPEMTLKHTYQSQGAATRAAKSRLESMTRSGSKIQISGMVGDPAMSAETEANLTGFRTGIDGDGWIINSVAHSFTSSGYTCSLDLEQKE